MTASWTASSQITGISREQKIEVVSTLTAYPLVIKEIEIMDEMLQTCEQIKMLFYEQIKTSEETILKLENINDKSEEQIELLKKQLKKKKGTGWIVPVLVGAIGGVLLGSSL